MKALRIIGDVLAVIFFGLFVGGLLALALLEIAGVF